LKKLGKFSCLEEGIFALKTLKSVENIYDREEEKKWLEAAFKSRAWFSVCGLRRTGKTTLVRSIAHALKSFEVVYINAWELPEEHSFEVFLERLKDGIIDILKRQKLKSALRKVSKVSFLGVSIEFREKAQLKLISSLNDLVNKKPLVIILDEAPYLLTLSTAQKFFAALHDTFAPNLVVAFAGSIITLKYIYERDETMPLYGRVEEELILEPFDEYTSKKYLEAGFEQCNLRPSQELIEKAVLNLGGFPGWLTLFGRISARKLLTKGEVETDKILTELEKRASLTIIAEVAKFLRFKRNFKVYLKILKKIAIDGETTLTEISRAISRDPSTTTFYLNQLMLYGIIKKENKKYRIVDPLLRRIIQKPNFEREVKARI